MEEIREPEGPKSSQNIGTVGRIRLSEVAGAVFKLLVCKH